MSTLQAMPETHQRSRDPEHMCLLVLGWCFLCWLVGWLFGCLSTDPAGAAFNIPGTAGSPGQASNSRGTAISSPAFNIPGTAGNRQPKRATDMPSFQYPRHRNQHPRRCLQHARFNSPGAASTAQAQHSTYRAWPAKMLALNMHETKMHGVPRSPPLHAFSWNGGSPG